MYCDYTSETDEGNDILEPDPCEREDCCTHYDLTIPFLVFH